MDSYRKQFYYEKLIDGIKSLCFPQLYKRNSLHKVFKSLSKILINKNKKIIQRFKNDIPQLILEIKKDGDYYLLNDPAVVDFKEVVYCYPGFVAIIAYRVAHLLTIYGDYLSARALSEYAHFKTGIDIHPSSEIAAPFFIDHGTGIVIGATTIIKKNVRLYQGVTLGALSLSDWKENSNKKRHPTIEEDVIIYAHAIILGGDTVIGAHSIVGAQTLIKKSVPESSIVTLKETRKRLK